MKIRKTFAGKVPENKIVNAKSTSETDAYSCKYLNDLIYPVGSIYMNVNLVEPSLLFGGTWERLKDTFLLGAGDTYEAGSTGGEAEHTLTTDEMPSHYHGLWKLPLVDSYGGGATAQGYSLPSLSAKNAQKIISENAGGNQPHNNMPPYLTVYMWKRIG